MEAHETDQLALAREIREELGVSAKIGTLVATGEDRHIELRCYRVTFEAEPAPEPPRIGAWFTGRELSELDMPPADWPAREFAVRWSKGHQ